MPRTIGRSALPVIVLAVLTLGLTACSDDDPSSGPTFDAPTGEASNPVESCEAVVGSGAVEDIQEVFDKYKDNNEPFTPADEQAMRDALDRLAKAGDNAAPEIREDVVTLVADAGSQIDGRAGLPGTGDVASSAKIQRQIDNLCR